MKLNRPSKMLLHRETLRYLDRREIAQANGGVVTVTTCPSQHTVPCTVCHTC